MKILRPGIGIALLFLPSATAADKGASDSVFQSSTGRDCVDFSKDDHTGLVLPKCPRGCVVKIYLPMTFAGERFPVFDQQRHIGDAKPYFESVGVAFPKGGFAWYFKPQKLLVISTTQKNLDLIEALVTPSE
jgi:hypothetical protein